MEQTIEGGEMKVNMSYEFMNIHYLIWCGRNKNQSAILVKILQQISNCENGNNTPPRQASY